MMKNGLPCSRASLFGVHKCINTKYKRSQVFLGGLIGWESENVETLVVFVKMLMHESNGFLWSDSVGGGGTLSLDGSGGPETGRGGASPPLGLEDWWIGRI